MKLNNMLKTIIFYRQYYFITWPMHDLLLFISPVFCLLWMIWFAWSTCRELVENNESAKHLGGKHSPPKSLVLETGYRLEHALILTLKRPCEIQMS